MGEHLDQLNGRLRDVTNLERAAAVLSWDQHTFMPPGGSAARAEQLGTLSRLGHTIFTAPETADLLARAEDEVHALPGDSDEVRAVRVTRHDYDLATKIPSALVSEMGQHATLATEVWVRARRDNDFASFAPCLEKTVRLHQELAECLGYDEEPYDALLDAYEPGMRASDIVGIFATLRDQLVPLVRAIAERAERVDDALLRQPFNEVEQESFGRVVAEAIGYDFQRGRQDRSAHPFETTFSRDDVRMTIRFEQDFLSAALFGTLHESGHAIYEQGVAQALDGTILGQGTSLGFHESQSRLWENVVGRSRGFWEHFFPILQERFPRQLGSTSLESFYRAINRVSPSLIRVEADEVTYNLHIMLRFEMERDLLLNRYSVRDAPQVWNDRMESYLGVRPPTDTLGILQDIHWTSSMGYFPTYSLGNILSVQLYEQAMKDIPDIPEQIKQGHFEPLRMWLTEHVYRYGRKYPPTELVERVTGGPLQSGPYVNYLHQKYGELYELN